MAEKFSLKDELFNAETIADLSGYFTRSSSSFDGADFDGAGFQEAVLSAFPGLELKARIDHIARVLEDHLPRAFPAAAAVIHHALPPELDPELSDDDFGRFIIAPLGEYVVNQGLEEHFECSMTLLHALTRRFSMEFALRHFLIRWPEETFAMLLAWSGDENYHVRRLASEATRPKLPWGKAIPLMPGAALPILDRLFADPTRFVTRSVANHLNDIAKTRPEFVVETLDRWAQTGAQNPAEMAWMTRHALRGLVKQGHGGALALLGYRPDAEVEVVTLSIDRDCVEIGGTLGFDVTLSARRREPVVVDFVIDFVKANGSQKPKVFKMKQVVLDVEKPVKISKVHRFKKGATTFTHYPGQHRLNIQVNGRILAGADFTLE